MFILNFQNYDIATNFLILEKIVILTELIEILSNN